MIALIIANILMQAGILIAIVLAYRNTNKERRAVKSDLEAKAEETGQKLSNIHELVNSRLAVALEENKTLRKMIRESGAWRPQAKKSSLK